MDPSTFYAQGNAEFVEERYAEAVSAYNVAIELADDQAAYFRARAAAHLKLGDFAAALEDSAAAVRLDVSNAMGHFRLGPPPSDRWSLIFQRKRILSIFSKKHFFCMRRFSSGSSQVWQTSMSEASATRWPASSEHPRSTQARSRLIAFQNPANFRTSQSSRLFEFRRLECHHRFDLVFAMDDPLC